jgi:hypothetical protein
VVRTLGGTLAAATAGVGSAAASGGESDWRALRTPITETLRDVAFARSGPFAVGDDGTVLARGGGRWTVRRSEGPNGEEADLHAVAATGDGHSLWVAGEGGTLAAYDPGTDRVTTRPAPADGPEFTDLAVVGDAGTEVVLASDDSGRIHRLDRSTDDGWTHATPGSGATVSALAAHCRHRAVAVDTNGSAFERTREGWRTVGVEDADANFYGVSMPPSGGRGGDCECRSDDGGEGGCSGCDRCGRAVLVGGNGTVRERNGDGWQRVRQGGGTLRAVAWGRKRVSVGANGTVLTRPEEGWVTDSTPTDAALHAVTAESPTVAVGANGTVLEK